MQKLLQFLSKIALPGMLLFFLAFIPLFPKLPLLDIFGTWVYIRLEDFLVLSACAIFGVMLLTKKASLKTPLTLPIFLFWMTGAISLVIALVFIFPQLSNVFPHIALLHYIRRIEYIVLFFLAFAVIHKHRSFLPWVIGVLVVTSFIIVFYGFGQKYAGFPAFSTMNEEFAKGVPLRLPPTARIMSTFAGHYDLAAYLVLTIPLFGSLIFGTRKIAVKLVICIVAVLSFILLLLTASRVSFGVYLLTISVMLWWQKKRLLIIPVIIVSVIMVNFVSGASDRFLKTLRFNDVVVDLSTGKPIGTLEKVEGGTAVLERISEPDEENLPKGSGFINIPSGQQATASGGIGQVEFIKKKDLVAGKGDVATISGSFLVQKAFVLDISITTRFQGQWPRAIAAFKRNILTGSGYSSLNLAADGNYHRMLGETGILGTVAYLGIFIYAFYWYWKKRSQLKGLEYAFVTGIFAGIVGLLANAVLIDVFEASKVAFPLWMLLGIAMAILARHPLNVSYLQVLRRLFTHKLAIFAYFAIGIFLLFGQNISSYFIGDDFTWLKWAAESNIQSISHYFTQAQGFFYRPIPKLWYFLLFSVFWLMPQAYHIASISLFLAIGLLTFFLMRQLGVKSWISALFTVVFAGLSVHHENVFWISGHSSLLAVSTFLTALNLFIYHQKQSLKYSRLIYIVAVIMLMVSMFSWETLVVGPIIAVSFLVLMKKNKMNFWLLLLIPIYLWFRGMSGAVPPEGDYGYNLQRVVVNGIGNTLTYLTAIFGGPRVIEYFVTQREWLRVYAMPLTIVSLLGFAISAYVMWQKRHMLRTGTSQLICLIALFWSLVPFIGLGAASERYALLPSVFVIIISSLVFSWLWMRYSRIFMRCMLLLSIVLLVWFNVSELNRLSQEWRFSANVTEQSLKAIRAGFFPPTNVKTFVFIDVPIRQGRAWIYPTGLNDALWHMFRQSPYYVTQVSTINDAFVYPHPKDTDKIILQFENFTLKQIVKEPDQIP